MADKLKCTQCGERDAFAKGLCSRCYGANWRRDRAAARAGVEPKQLTAGDDAIQGEIVHDDPKPPETHLVATSPVEMQAAQGDMKLWLEQRLAVLERDIIEANAALDEARRHGWATAALTSARNRAVDDETFYNKILIAVEAGYTVIPDFPLQVFAVRRGESPKLERNTFQGAVRGQNTYLGRPVDADCAPAGAGEYRNPTPETFTNVSENRAPNAQERGGPRWYTRVTGTGDPAGPILFPHMTARAPIMQATAKAMDEKVFDQFGVCLPVFAVGLSRQVETSTTRAGDPLVIGQILHKRVGSRQRCVSFIIAWHLNLNDL